MGNYTEFMLYEELLSFFELESDELLCKMFEKLPELSNSYFSNENFVRNASGEIVVFMNDYQRRIVCMFDVLAKLWFSRN